MPIWLIPLLTALFEAFEGCNTNSSKSKKRERFRRPRRREIRGIAVVLRRERGFRGWELRAKTFEVLDAMASATDQQVDNFLACGTVDIDD